MSTSVGSDDASLIARSLNEPAAFATLYERHADAVFRYGASRLGRDSAGDLTSESFLVAFERRDRYDPTVSSALPWLLGIATRLIRRRRREEAVGWRALAVAAGLGGEGTARLEHRHDSDTDARIDAGAAVGGIAEAIVRLPKRDRDVLTLTAWSELDSAGISEALGIPEGTVRSRLHRARRILRAELEAGGAHRKELDHERLG